MARSPSATPKRAPKPDAPAPQPAPPVQGAARSTLASFRAIVDRVEQVIESETEALTLSRPIDLAVLHRQKRQGLLELSRIMRTITGVGADTEARQRLDQLADKLETNRIVLDRKLRAVREVADIIAVSMKESESDGTYSRTAGQR